MIKHDIINQSKSFIEELNDIYIREYFQECLISFEGTINQPFVFYPKQNLINFNINLIEKNIDQLKYADFFGVEYYKYCILHEYGHFIYCHRIENFFKNIYRLMYHGLLYQEINAELCEKYNQLVNEFFNDKQEQLDYSYLARQKLAADEFLADYFVYKNIEKFFTKLNFKDYIKWRINNIIIHYKNINEKKIYIFKTYDLSYYHIPAALNNLNITCEDEIKYLVELSMMHANKTLLLAYNQIKNKSEYMKENFIENLILLN